ncbi:drug resistance transporter, EmrB/QacA subfamily [Catenulispora acidiphila DSM 44928]|uniref:Drug resistance transporter, EmrB/QacA subfamily n=1 Tax=Catenulispora acidiphila (strain DSM 44928 / JCM 14897 / NBRC 102108 / NRRL B-24433 / ID139908) TaxID=479433 RepID=C7PWN9_CATAD|nr:MFS transporter [Catenulispora acidiphila]ACU75319.1 drug resistance transporter, EmrB/QacA subfamily [Catenulispora acidiphila DSM 44928]
MEISDVGGEPAAGAGRNGQSGVLFAMCLSLVLVVASVSALNLALPNLAVELGATNSALTWIADGYTVALAALVLPLGALGDRIGRRKVLIAGNLVFGTAAVFAAYSPTTSDLIVSRVVMGIGAAMIMPGTLSTITAVFPPEKKDRGVAIWSGFAAAGAIIGMLVAGGLLERFSWTSIFWASSATAVVCAVAAWALAPETRSSERQRFDYGGSVTTAVAIGALVYGIVEGNESGWTRPEVVAAFAVAVLGLAAYVPMGLRTRHPLLDPRLFKLRGFRAGTLAILTQFMAVFGFFFVGLQFLQLILSYSPLKSAIALVPVAAVVLPTSVLTPRLAERLGVRTVMPAGLLCLAGGMFWLTMLHVDSGYLVFLGALVLAGVGIGLTSSTGTSAIVESLGPDSQGVASAMNDTTREVGSAVGIALMGSVFSSHYRSALPADVSRLPAQAAAAVHHSAAAGLEAASRLGVHGAPLAAAVRGAFMSGFTTAMGVIAAILAAAALVCAFTAPRRSTSDAAPLGEQSGEPSADAIESSFAPKR